MQDNENEYESTNEYGETPKPSGNGLRAQLETVLAEKRELEAKYQEAQAALRERSIQETLAGLGVNAKVAKFIPSNVTDKESIQQWVTDNADVFNIQVGGNQAVTPQPTVDPSIVAGANRLNQLSSSAQSPSKIQDIEARIASATSKEELEGLWAEARAYLL
jgi:diaminopimelate epimerase